MESVLQEVKECYVCKSTYNLHSHHVFFGTANRKQSEKYGMKVWLCMEHHTGSSGVHHNRDLDLHLKKFAQRKFEALYGDNTSFQKVFGRNYL